jgi:hypothetical protein
MRVAVIRDRGAVERGVVRGLGPIYYTHNKFLARLSRPPKYGEDIRRMMCGRHEVRLARRDGSEAAIIRINLSALDHSAVNYSAKNSPA